MKNTQNKIWMFKQKEVLDVARLSYQNMEYLRIIR